MCVMMMLASTRCTAFFPAYQDGRELFVRSDQVTAEVYHLAFATEEPNRKKVRCTVYYYYLCFLKVSYKQGARFQMDKFEEISFPLTSLPRPLDDDVVWIFKGKEDGEEMKVKH